MLTPSKTLNARVVALVAYLKPRTTASRMFSQGSDRQQLAGWSPWRLWRMCSRHVAGLAGVGFGSELVAVYNAIKYTGAMATNAAPICSAKSDIAYRGTFGNHLIKKLANISSCPAMSSCGRTTAFRS